MNQRRRTSSTRTSEPKVAITPESEILEDSRAGWAWVLWGSMAVAGASFLCLLPDPTPVFVNHRLTAVHLLAAIPLAYCLACQLRIPRRIARWFSLVAVGVATSLGATLTLLSDFMIPATWEFGGRWMIRTAVAFAVVLPWIISCPLPCSNPTWRGWILAMILMTLPSSLYADHLLQQLNRASVQIDPATAPKKLMLVTQQMMEIDDTSEVGGENCKKKLLALLQRVESLDRECQLSFSPSSNGAKIDRAVKLMAIDRFAEAREHLNPIQPDEGSVILLKILCARGLEEWKSVQELCETALQDSIDDTPLERSRLYAWLAEAFARQRRLKECIDVQRIAIDKCPDHADAFRMDLAQRLAESGQVPEALEILQELERTDRASDTQFQSSIREIQRGIKNNSCTLSR